MSPLPHSNPDGPVTTSNLFRTVNLEIRRLSRRWDEAGVKFEAVCECDDATCALSITVDRALFDDVVGCPGRYLVAAAHRRGEGDRVVHRDREVVVVERRPEPVTT